jgi:hypothetical protein
MLGCGNTYGYKLLNAGELESFVDGKARKITVASIYGYIERKLTAESTATQTALMRRRGLKETHRRKGDTTNAAGNGAAVGEERPGLTPAVRPPRHSAAYAR